MAIACALRTRLVVPTKSAYNLVLVAISCTADKAGALTSPKRCASLASVRSAMIALTSAAPYFLHDSSACTRSQRVEQECDMLSKHLKPDSQSTEVSCVSPPHQTGGALA